MAVPTANLSPSQIAKNQIEIGGRLYVSVANLACIMGISERTLSHRCANGGAPPQLTFDLRCEPALLA
jgi:hypothetical protein